MPSTKLILFLSIGLLFSFQSFQSGAQNPVYTDYIGAGHFEGIVVSTSSDLGQTGWGRMADGLRTIDGAGLDGKKMEASRFLSQAAYGGTPAEIETLANNLDFEGWLNWQKELPTYPVLQLSRDAWNKNKQLAQQQGINPNSIDWHSRHFQAGLWTALLQRPDVLRNRMALALHEIMVIGIESNIGFRGNAYAAYYDVLRKHAFGDFKALLLEVSLHPTMGVYLTHFRNSATDTSNNTFPDENYAREIMQLFTIGLYELQPNGTPRLDAQGNTMDAYGQDDIRELAKVFTGLGAGAVNQEGIAANRALDFFVRRNFLSYEHAMLMYEDWHEQGPKHVLGHTINTGSGMGDIEAAIDVLVNHPNTPPFFCKKLIQQLVTSNPSPKYVQDVAAVFINDGSGKRGNLYAVLSAILLHDEARSCEAMQAAGHGKLRAPMMRYLQFAKAMDYSTFQGLTWPHHNTFNVATSHFAFSSPSVFNFYLPDYQPNGPVADMGLMAPEFEIHNAVTSVGYVNEVDFWTRQGRIFGSADLPTESGLNYSTYLPEMRDADVILNQLDVYFSHGRLSDDTRATIKKALTNYNPSAVASMPDKDPLDLALYLLLISPDYTILK